MGVLSQSKQVVSAGYLNNSWDLYRNYIRIGLPGSRGASMGLFGFPANGLLTPTTAVRLWRLPSSVAPSMSSSKPLGPLLDDRGADGDDGPELSFALSLDAAVPPLAVSTVILSSSCSSSSSSLSPERNPRAPAPPRPLYFLRLAPSSSIRCTA